MGITGAEEYLQRMEDVGANIIDNQQMADLMRFGVESTSLIGDVPGNENLIENEFLSKLPEPQIPDNEASQDAGLSLAEFDLSTEQSGPS